jgi:uncharacterized protein
MILLSRIIPISSSRTRLSLLVIGLCLMVAACEHVEPRKQSLDQVISSTETGVVEDKNSPEYYIQQANQSQGEQRQQYLLKAAELLYQRGDLATAQSQLANLQPDQMAAQRQQDIQLLAARIAVASNNPSQASALIPADDLLTPQQQLEARKIRADIDFANGYFMQAALARIALDRQLLDPKERERNHHRIWRALSALPTINLKNASSTDATTQGWLELARIMRNAQTNIDGLQTAILNWGTRFPQHPVSNAFIDSILNEYIQSHTMTGGIAVLLPLSGKLKTTSEAIQNGFISAYYQEKSHKLPGDAEPTIRFYDSGEGDANFMQVYHQAILDGASTVVGALDKSVVDRLAQQAELEVPVLSLNYSENPLSNASNLYQFGLLPEDEARQAAELAVHQHKLHAVVLVPGGEWGQRIAKAFSQRYTELGGKVMASQLYAADKDQYSWPIRHMLNITDSEDRRQSIENLLSTRVKFVPRRRQDVDMIFLAATPRSARSIMPAFKFHHAGNLPVYSTSSVYTGHVDRRADQDLNGMVFCDIPWDLTSDNPLRNVFMNDWPEQKNYTRLFALGIDAYHLLQNMSYLTHNSYARFSGETGNIYLGANNRLHRELVWAQFKHGVPVYMDTTIPSEPVIEHDENNDT